MPEQMEIETQEEKKKRADGRDFKQLRPFSIQRKVLEHASGGAYFEMGNTKIEASVYGPKQPARFQDSHMEAQVLCNVKFDNPNTPNLQSEDLRLWLQEALERTICVKHYPKSSIEIEVTVIQNDGNVLGAALTCCGIALVDAGIEVFDILVGLSLVRTEQGVLLDPTAEEECEPNCVWVNLGLHPAHQQMASFHHIGLTTSNTLKEDISLLKNEIAKLARTIRITFFKTEE